MKKTIYTCPMHPEVQQEKPGRCPKCGMSLVPKEVETKEDEEPEPPGHGEHHAMTTEGAHEPDEHREHQMSPVASMSFWQKFKMSMRMTMGMEHGGLAGREMAKLMEEDIRSKFFFSLVLSIPIIAYSPLGIEYFGLRLPEPIPAGSFFIQRLRLFKPKP